MSNECVKVIEQISVESMIRSCCLIVEFSTDTKNKKKQVIFLLEA